MRSTIKSEEAARAREDKVNCELIVVWQLIGDVTITLNIFITTVARVATRVKE